MMENEPTESRHAATDKDKCDDMADKYGWELVRVEPTENPILEVDCVFDGETEFPNYQEKTDE